MYHFVVPKGTPFGVVPNWLEAYAMAQESPKSAAAVMKDPVTQYLSAMYWAFTTMTTVGYGDILPQNICARPARSRARSHESVSARVCWSVR